MSVAEITPQVAAPGKMWHILILKAFEWIGDYGWSIVVFTVLLKLILSPLDFFQRYKMNKNQKITERLKPTMEKIQKQYGADKQAFSQKQMELNRKEGYSYFSSCLPMIVTMVVFITLWLSMQTVAQYKTLQEYTTLYDEYNVVCELAKSDLGTDADRLYEGTEFTVADTIAQDVVYRLYYDGINDNTVSEIREKYGLSENFVLENRKRVQASFLWIKNIWAPDVPWGDQATLDWAAFVKATGNANKKYNNPEYSGLGSETFSNCVNQTTYERVMHKLLYGNPNSDVNGYLILPVLVVLLSVASQVVSMLQQKKAGQTNNKGGVATSMKVMMFIMPVMMAVFAIQYASIFTLYMVTNSATTLFFNFSFTGIIKLIDKRKRTRNYGISSGSTRSGKAATMAYDKSPIIHYVKGANPDAGKKPEKAPVATVDGGDGKTRKKDKKAVQSTSVRRSGRPDPNELMNMDMGSRGSGTKKRK